jgi:lambda family phage tail tape measure protein
MNKVQITIEAYNKAKTAFDELTKQVKGVDEGIKSSDKNMQAFGSRAIAVGNIVQAVFGVAIVAAMTRALVEPFKKGLAAADDYKTSLATLSAITLTFMKQEGTIDQRWKEAKEYAEGLIPAVEDLAAKTLLSGEQANMMVQEFAKAGQVIDATNKSQTDGLQNIANALFVVTGGRNLDMQIITEIGHLMAGQVTAQDRLGKLLLAVDPELQKHLKTWTAEGTVIEHIGQLLQGFEPATKDLAETWNAVKSTIETTTNQILRGAMLPAYGQIMGVLSDIQILLNDHKDTIQQGIHKAWVAVSGIVRSVFDLLLIFKGPLTVASGLVGMMLEGWGAIFAVLPAVTGRIRDIFQAIWESVKMVGHFGEALYRLVIGDFAGSKNAWEQAKKNWNESGRLTGQAFAGGFGQEVDKLLTDYYSKGLSQDKRQGKLPKLNRSLSEDEDATAKKAKSEFFGPDKTEFEKYKRAAEEVLNKIRDLTEDEFEVRRQKAMEWYQEQAAILGNTPDLYKALQLEIATIDSEAADERAKIAKEMKDSWLDSMGAITDQFETLSMTEKEQMLPLMEEFMQKLASTGDIGSDAYNRIFEALKRYGVELKELNQLQIETNGTFQQGMSAGIDEYFAHFETKFQEGKDLVINVAQEMEQGFNNFFFDAMTGKLQTLQDYWRSFANAVMGYLSEIMAKQAMSGLFGNGSSGGSGLVGAFISAFGMAGGSSMPAGSAIASDLFVGHTGGAVKNLGHYVPKFHLGGLASDERMTVNKVGERYITAEQNEWLTNVARTIGKEESQVNYQQPPVIVHMTVNAIDAKSFEGRIMESKNAIAAAVMSAGSNNHPARRSR